MAISKITSKSIADGTVVGADITPGTVTNAKISPSAAIANAKLQNSAITINGASTSLGGSATVNTATDWQALTVADGSTQLTAVAGKGYFLDTNAGVIEVFLPTSPSRGDRIVLADYSGTFATNQCIVNTGGKLIDSTTGPDFKLTTNNTIAEFIYVDAAKGWLVYLNQAAGTTPDAIVTGNYDVNTISATGGTITESGDFKIHTFTGDGNFVVATAGDGTDAAPSIVDYLVVAGGGGAGGEMGGGGGGGGFRVSNATCMPSPLTSPLASPTGITVTAQTYPVTVGAGGAGGTPAPNGGCKGSDSVFSTITSTGGGLGAASNASTDPAGGAGGSGGGGGGSPSGTPGGTGNTPPVSPAQGNNGGNGAGGGSSEAGGGGGGAGAAGTNGATGSSGGNGGVGSFVVSSGFAGCNGTPGPVSNAKYFSGGGGGGGAATVGTAGTGGSGGGAQGRTPGNPGDPQSGTANTGGGGGGQKNGTQAGGAGGKGIVIIRYKFQ